MDLFSYPKCSCTFEKQRTHQWKSSGSSSSIKPSILCVDLCREDTETKSHSKLCLLSVNISSWKRHCHGIVQSCINSCNFVLLFDPCSLCPGCWIVQLSRTGLKILCIGIACDVSSHAPDMSHMNKSGMPCNSLLYLKTNKGSFSMRIPHSELSFAIKNLKNILNIIFKKKICESLKSYISFPVQTDAHWVLFLNVLIYSWMT